MLRLAVSLAILVPFLGACQNDGSTRLSLMASLDQSSVISLSEALAIAQQDVPGGFVVEAALELEDDDEQEPPAYEVVLYVAADNQIIEVEVHAITGEVLEVEIEDDGDDDEVDDD